MLFKIIKILLALIVVKHVVKVALILGFHKTSLNHWPGPCRAVPPIEHGAEDIILTKDGMAVITSGIDVTYRGDHADPRIIAAEGKLFAFDFNNPDQNATELKLGIDFEFVPHGIGIWESPGGEDTRLFVVNHRKDADTIEIFKLMGSAAKPIVQHVESVSDPLFTSVNDVLPIGPASFYASNDGYLRFTFLRVFERLLERPWGSVVFRNKDGVRTVINSVFEYNGMGLSGDGSFVYISNPVASSIAIYKRSSETNNLSFHQEIFLGIMPDNIFVHPETGDLWSGANAIAYKLLAAFENIDNLAPSMVIRVRPLGPKEDPFKKFKVYDVYQDDGDLMSTSSSAAIVGNKLLAGSIFQKMIYCDMKTETTLSREVY